MAGKNVVCSYKNKVKSIIYNILDHEIFNDTNSKWTTYNKCMRKMELKQHLQSKESYCITGNFDLSHEVSNLKQGFPKYKSQD